MINEDEIDENNIIPIMVEHSQKCNFCNGRIRYNGRYILCDEYQQLEELRDRFFPEPFDPKMEELEQKEYHDTL